MAGDVVMAGLGGGNGVGSAVYGSSLTLSMPYFSVSVRTWCIFAPVALRGLNMDCM